MVPNLYGEKKKSFYQFPPSFLSHLPLRGRLLPIQEPVGSWQKKPSTRISQNWPLPPTQRTKSSVLLFFLIHNRRHSQIAALIFEKAIVTSPSAFVHAGSGRIRRKRNMKFKKGNPVEVMRRQDKSCGGWFPASVISVDAQGYTVRFEHFRTAEGEQVVEKVQLDDVRPYPPLVANERKWALGDIVEVFDLYSWRVGKVAKVLRNNRFIIGLFGSIQLKEFDSSIVRVLQAWRNGKWVRIEKGNGEKQIPRYPHKLHFGTEIEHQESFIKEICHQSPFKKISPVSHAKRKSSFQLKSCADDDKTGNVKKQKATLGGCHLATGTLSKEVNVISLPKGKVAEKYLHAAIKENNIRPCGLDLRREYTSLYPMQQSSLPLRVIEENVECSVASCSANILPEYVPNNSLKSCRDIAGNTFDDAESSCPLEPRGNYSHFAKDNIAENVHMLELHAYKSTVQALYASGPLSWEQESLLTNLRLSLHISNEEHLLQIRDLLSA